MATILYRSGEAGTLGFPVDDPTGQPMPSEGLQARMVIYLAGAELTIPGRWSSGEFLISGEQIIHPSVMAFDIEADTMPVVARLYPCALQINDGTTGWRTLPDGDFNLEIRRF